MVHPPEPSVIMEGREENTHLLICAGGGHLCHNLISGNTKEKLLF
jgi:hypothetical protein